MPKIVNIDKNKNIFALNLYLLSALLFPKIIYKYLLILINFHSLCCLRIVFFNIPRYLMPTNTENFIGHELNETIIF